MIALVAFGIAVMAVLVALLMLPDPLQRGVRPAKPVTNDPMPPEGGSGVPSRKEV